MNFIEKIKVLFRQRRLNNEYLKGKWDYLSGDKESVRYQKIVELINTHGIENPSILDLGAGEGVLNHYLTKTNYNYFLGVDFSSVSIEKAKQKQIPNADFLVADVHTFKPNKRFDIIIFNEVIYYIQPSERQNVLNTMINQLNENGIIITSIFKEGHGCWEIFNSNVLKSLETISIKTSDPNIYWKIGVYRKV